MGTLNEDLNAIKTVEDTLIANKVAKFAYTDTAYANNDADGVDEYDYSNEQNIPDSNATTLKVNPTVLNKGWRSQASSITRMLMNHFLGRLSYNVNKVNDNMSNLIATLISHRGTANGFATLDEDGTIPQIQLPAIDLSLTEERKQNKAWIDGKDIYTQALLANSAIAFTSVGLQPYVYPISSSEVTSQLESCIYKDTLFVLRSLYNNETQEYSYSIFTSPIGVNYNFKELEYASSELNLPSTEQLISIFVWNDTLFLSSVQGIYRFDGKIFSKEVNNVYIKSYCVFNNVLYVGTNAGLYKYVQTSWVSPLRFVQVDSFPTTYTVNAISVFNDTLYIGTQGNGLYTSTDASTFTLNSSYPATSTASPRCMYTYKNTLYIGAQSDGFLFSSTDGATFTRNTSWSTSLKVISFCEYDNILYIGTNGQRLYKTTDGSTFSYTLISSLSSSSDTYLFTYNGVLYLSTDDKWLYTNSINNITLNKEVDNILQANLITDKLSCTAVKAVKQGSNSLVIGNNIITHDLPTYAVLEYTKN